MKKVYFILSFVAIVATSAISQGTWLMGGEFQFRQYPNDPNKVIVTLNLYRQCQGGGFPAATSVKIWYNAPNCCLNPLSFKILPRVNALSAKEISPLCPFNPILTTCSLPSSSAPGARIYVYADTIDLKGLKCDWIFRYTSPGALCNPDTVPEPSPPVNPPNCWMNRSNARNISAAGENKYFTLMGLYKNNIPYGNSLIGNTSPLYVSNPILYLCEGQDREYDFGYYDLEGDRLEFEPTQPFGKDQGTPLVFAGGASFTDPFGPQNVALGEYFNFDKKCGRISLKVIVSKLGYYAFAFKIKEWRKPPGGGPEILVGETTRDLVVTVINTPNCGDPNSVTKQSYYGPINPVNINANGIRLADTGFCNQRVETCKGRLLKFDIQAFAANTAPGAALNVVVTEPPTVNRVDIKMSSDYTDGILLDPDTAYGHFEWNVPANTKPGKYPFLFQIRDCIDGFIVSKQLLIEVIVDDPTKLDYDSLKWCPSGQALQAKVIGGPIVKWRVISGDFNAVTDQPQIPPGGNWSAYGPTIDFISMNQKTCFEAQSDNFCDNRDTICVDSVGDLSLDLNPLGPVAKCYLDTIQLSVSTAPSQGPFTYNWFSNCMISPNVGPAAVGTVCLPFTIFKVTVTGGNGCQMTLSKNVPWLGIRPTAIMSSDRNFVCPLDTISITTDISDALCGQDDYNTCGPNSKTSEIVDNKVSPFPFPQLYAGQLRSGRTQVLYRGDELYKAGFRAGRIDEIAFDVESFVNPLYYENIELFYKCTSIDSLKKNSFETGMIPIKAKIPSQILSFGWNVYPLDLGLEFTWDGKTNIVFELRYTCNATQKASAQNRCQFTQYTSITGTYWDQPTLQSAIPTFSGGFRPNLRMKYCIFNPINYAYKWTPSYGLTDTTIKNPQVVFHKPVTYSLTATSPNGCAYTSKVYVDYDTNFAVKINPHDRDKCNFDTVEVHAKPNIIPKKPPYTYTCISVADPLKNCDTASDKTVAKMGTGVVSTATFNPTLTPFKGAFTDGRCQMLYRASELKGGGLKAGLIDQISYLVMSKGSTTGFAGLTIKMMCTGLNTLPTTGFLPSTLFHQVYSKDYNTTIGENFFKLDKPYEWDGVSNIVIEICFDNTGTAATGTHDNVEMTQILPATDIRHLLNGQNNSSGCALGLLNWSNYRPNVKLYMCKPNRPKEPVVYKYEWIPNYMISNIAAKDVIIWNDVTTKYVVRATYQNGCKVYDTLRINVGKPAVDFLPSPAVVCKGDNVDIDVLNMSSSTYEYKWKDQPGYVLDPLRTVAPTSPKYYYVRTRATPGKDTLCYRDDSILINIQEKAVMPDLGTKAFICEGSSLNLSVDSGAGYKNVKWLYNGVPIASGYQFKASLPGTYYVRVDSGACTNLSTPKVLEERPLEIAKVFPPIVNICKGEIATIFYQGSSGVGNVDWNRGNPSALKEKVFVTDAGKVYLKDPQNQYGCPMIVDSATVNVFDTPSVDLGPDIAFCQGVGQEVELKVLKPTVGANYIWNDNVLGAGRIVSKSGKYTITANLSGCLKSASINVTNDTIGSIYLGPKMAQCCGTVIDHLAVAVEDPKYIRFLWSTGDITPNLYLKDNDKNGRFWLKAYKANGCYDEGFLDIENKCSELRILFEKDEIYLSKDNKGYAKHLSGITGERTYSWLAKDAVNLVSPANVKNPVFSPTDTGLIYYSVTTRSVDSSYNPPFVCEEVAEAPFRVLPADIYIPKIFSPNGDNVNDFLKITKKGEVNLREVRIFNRWGELMHDDPNLPWDGFYKGQAQPAGTYIMYVVYDRVEVRAPRSTAKIEFPITLIR